MNSVEITKQDNCISYSLKRIGFELHYESVKALFGDPVIKTYHDKADDKTD